MVVVYLGRWGDDKTLERVSWVGSVASLRVSWTFPRFVCPPGSGAEFTSIDRHSPDARRRRVDPDRGSAGSAHIPGTAAAGIGHVAAPDESACRAPTAPGAPWKVTRCRACRGQAGDGATFCSPG